MVAVKGGVGIGCTRTGVKVFCVAFEGIMNNDVAHKKLRFM